MCLLLACASAKDFASDIVAPDAQLRRDRCRQLGEIPALLWLFGCGRAAASGRRDRNRRSPLRSHPYCPVFVAFALADQMYGSTCRAWQANPSISFNVYGRIWLRADATKFRDGVISGGMRA
jgi:hypothetical protein